MNKGIKILVTGAKGFIGKNLVAELRNRGYLNIFEVDRDTSLDLLNIYAKECGFIFHLAGVNRPKDEKEFMEGNFGFTSELLKLLCANINQVVSRDLALNQIWNDNNYFTTRSMDVFIAKLRKYLKEDSSLEIINVHGNGFRLLVK